MILQLAAVVLLWRQSSGHQKQQDLYYRWVGLISLETCVNCTLTEKIIFLLWKHNDKKITDSKQIVFQNKILMLSQCLLQSFDLINQSCDYPSCDHCIVLYTSGRSRSILIPVHEWSHDG